VKCVKVNYAALSGSPPAVEMARLLAAVVVEMAWVLTFVT
jgi:hypothetical protein